jgi:short-subunit dehydrogenase
MIESGEEYWIASVSGVGTFMMMPKNTAHLLTRHAIQSFSECLYLEMQLKGALIQISSALPVMVKTGIFDASAGKGEPEDAAAFRANMCNFMAQHGEDVD